MTETDNSSGISPLEQTLVSIAGNLDVLTNDELFMEMNQDALQVVEDLAKLKRLVSDHYKPSEVIPRLRIIASMARLFVMTDSSEELLRIAERYEDLNPRAHVVLDKLYPLVRA